MDKKPAGQILFVCERNAVQSPIVSFPQLSRSIQPILQMEALFNNSPEKPKHMKAFSAGAKVTSPGKRSPDKAKVEAQLSVSAV